VLPTEPAAREWSDKRRVVAGLLQILLGVFAVGRFYTGHTRIAVIQLIGSVLTWGVIGAVWGLVDGIILLTVGGTDARGRTLRP
jgi:TM2 domain-containing membrane protein YozV